MKFGKFAFAVAVAFGAVLAGMEVVAADDTPYLQAGYYSLEISAPGVVVIVR